MNTPQAARDVKWWFAGVVAFLLGVSSIGAAFAASQEDQEPLPRAKQQEINSLSEEDPSSLASNLAEDEGTLYEPLSSTATSRERKSIENSAKQALEFELGLGALPESAAQLQPNARLQQLGSEKRLNQVFAEAKEYLQSDYIASFQEAFTEEYLAGLQSDASPTHQYTAVELRVTVEEGVKISRDSALVQFRGYEVYHLLDKTQSQTEEYQYRVTIERSGESKNDWLMTSWTSLPVEGRTVEADEK